MSDYFYSLGMILKEQRCPLNIPLSEIGGWIYNKFWTILNLEEENNQ